MNTKISNAASASTINNNIFYHPLLNIKLFILLGIVGLLASCATPPSTTPAIGNINHPKYKEVVVTDFLDYTSHQQYFKEIDIVFLFLAP